MIGRGGVEAGCDISEGQNLPPRLYPLQQRHRWNGCDLSESMCPIQRGNGHPITVVIALGGSTNALLHLLAIANDARVRLALDDLTRIGKRVPVLADVRPSGRYVMSELIAIGGIQPLMKMLRRGHLLGGCLTVTGRTLAQKLANIGI